MTPTFDRLGQQALDVMEHSSRSLLLTGKAGTGKSTLIRHFLLTTTKRVLVLAPTGVAAVNVGGVTIHSFFGIHPGITIEEAQDGEYGLSKEKVNLLNKVETIVIDEISMVRADLMDVMNEILQQFFLTDEPFGGKQLIMVGDMFQLPPVVRGTEREYFQDVYGSPYFFAPSWYEDLDAKTIELQHIYRQEDVVFKSVLNKVRLGIQTEDDLNVLNACVGKKLPSETHPITLVTTNADAEKINFEQLELLDEEVETARAVVTGNVPKNMYMNDLLVTFKAGSQVMMLVNGDQYSNGSLGVIISYSSEEKKAVIDIDGRQVKVGYHTREIRQPVYNKEQKKIINEPVGAFAQLPFKLAWAITIHKSQGVTFDHVIVDLGRYVFAKGQSYVALSRVTSLEGLSLVRPIRDEDIHIDLSVRQFMSNALQEQIVDLIETYIEEQSNFQCIYVDHRGESELVNILPKQVGEMDYEGNMFWGLIGWCEQTQTERTFFLGRIFEIEGV